MDRIKHFPIPFFAVVMGLSGLAIAYQKAHHLFAFPKIIYEILMFSAAFVFVVVAFFYLLKAFLFFDEVKSDFFHPIRIEWLKRIKNL